MTNRTLPAGVIKRSGATAEFDARRVQSAIERAGGATGEIDPAQATRLAERVTGDLADARIPYPQVEDIQDLVEQTLLGAGHTATARAYIAHRERHARLRDDARTVVEVGSSINEYLDRSDWRVNANANQGYSLGGLILNTAGKVTANYWLSHVYTPEIGKAHREGDLHTAGAYPHRFAEVLPLCHWVGLDIKAPEHLYEAVTGVPSAAAKGFECLHLALASRVDLQVRTTVDPTVMLPDDVAELTAALRASGVREHVLQEACTQGARPEFAARLQALSGRASV